MVENQSLLLFNYNQSSIEYITEDYGYCTKCGKYCKCNTIIVPFVQVMAAVAALAVKAFCPFVAVVSVSAAIKARFYGGKETFG